MNKFLLATFVVFVLVLSFQSGRAMPGPAPDACDDRDIGDSCYRDGYSCQEATDCSDGSCQLVCVEGVPACLTAAES